MSRSKRSRFEPGGAPGLHLTPRDVAILKAVARYRVLHSGMIGRVVALKGFTPGGIDARHGVFDPAKRIRDRLTELFHGGFLARPRAAYSLVRPGSEPLTYALGREGEHLLAELHADDVTASARKTRIATRGFLEHQLLVNEVAIALAESASRKMEITIGEELLADRCNTTAHPFRFTAEVTLGTESKTIGIEPDLAFTIRTGERTYGYLVEVDRDTEPAIRSRHTRGGRTPTLAGTSLLRKLLAYAVIKRSGVVEKRLGWRNFKVLIVCAPRPGGGDRIDRLKETIRHHVPNQSGLFLLAPASDILCADDILDIAWLDTDGNAQRLAPERITRATETAGSRLPRSDAADRSGLHSHA